MYLNTGNLYDGFYIILNMKSTKTTKTSGEEIDQFLATIGQRLQQKRRDLGFGSYEQFALHHKLGRAQYGKYEKGTEDMRISSLYTVLKRMGMSWEKFLTGL